MTSTDFTHFGFTFPIPQGRPSFRQLNSVLYTDASSSTGITFVAALGQLNMESYVNLVNGFPTPSTSFFDVANGRGLVTPNCGNYRIPKVSGLFPRPSQTTCGFGYVFYEHCTATSDTNSLVQVLKSFGSNIGWTAMRIDHDVNRYLQGKEWVLQNYAGSEDDQMHISYVYLQFCGDQFLRKSTSSGSSLSEADWDFQYEVRDSSVMRYFILSHPSGKKIWLQMPLSQESSTSPPQVKMQILELRNDILYLDNQERLNYLHYAPRVSCRAARTRPPTHFAGPSITQCVGSSLTGETTSNDNTGAVAAGVILGLLVIAAAIAAFALKVKRNSGLSQNPVQETTKAEKIDSDVERPVAL